MPNFVRVWGNNEAGQVANAPKKNVKAIARGGSLNGLALNADGTPFFWGDGRNATGIPLSFWPASLAAEKFRAVALGRDDAVLIRENGTLVTFGRTAELKLTLPEGMYEAVAVGYNAVAIRKNDRTLKSWGPDTYTFSDPPRAGEKVTGLLNAPRGWFKEVAARTLYSLALDVDGYLYFWGDPPPVAPGQPPFLQDWLPTNDGPNVFRFPDEKFDAIAAGNAHALALRQSGTVMGWGIGNSGTPPPEVHFKAIAAGSGFSLGLADNGTLWGWGKPVMKAPATTIGWVFGDQPGWEAVGGAYRFVGEQFVEIAAAAFHVVALSIFHAGPADDLHFEPPRAPEKEPPKTIPRPRPGEGDETA
jgi:alpha-tubulin suppressor-like RCC1 family protein